MTERWVWDLIYSYFVKLKFMEVRFTCMPYGPIHVLSAEKTADGVSVTLDGVTKVVPPQCTPSVDYLGRGDCFGRHGDCIREARDQVEAVLRQVR